MTLLSVLTLILIIYLSIGLLITLIDIVLYWNEWFEFGVANAITGFFGSIFYGPICIKFWFKERLMKRLNNHD